VLDHEGDNEYTVYVMEVMVTEEEKAHSQQRQRLSLANGGLCSLSSVNMMPHGPFPLVQPPSMPAIACMRA
jgi:hypothetical protein